MELRRATGLFLQSLLLTSSLFLPGKSGKEISFAKCVFPGYFDILFSRDCGLCWKFRIKNAFSNFSKSGKSLDKSPGHFNPRDPRIRVPEQR